MQEGSIIRQMRDLNTGRERYEVFPPIKEICYGKGRFSLLSIRTVACAIPIESAKLGKYPFVKAEDGYVFYTNDLNLKEEVMEEQGYRLSVSEKGIYLCAGDESGLRYGLDTLEQILKQAGDEVECLTIYDYPILKQRGLMLDISRGKVFTGEYLTKLTELLSALRYNVLQLYVEHTFGFKKHPEICEGSDPITAEDIRILQEKCKEKGIQLQANLQSLGHCRRLLTRKAYRGLAESDMYWSLNLASEEVTELLDDLYGEYLPLFENEYFNAGLDEPYDIGAGKNKGSGKTEEELYLEYVLKIHALAAKYGKRIMIFGDVFCRNPELFSKLPKDIICLDWIYDPKERYGTPEILYNSGVLYWVCPGTGNWNTLFPRLDGAITNVVNLVREGCEHRAQGMLLTDWNDHGAYTQPAPGYYIYVYGAAAAWHGKDPGSEYVDRHSDRYIGIKGYARMVRKLAEIYQIPPLWSKNRSECVMALFDEPIFGKGIRGRIPPKGLRAYDVNLPDGVKSVLEKHSQHPLRPYFQISEDVCGSIEKVVADAEAICDTMKEGMIKGQMRYILDAFSLMLDKMEVSRTILSAFEKKAIDKEVLLDMEDSVRRLIRRFVRLEMSYIKQWQEIARVSEIEISMVHFAHVIERLDYLMDWLSAQREKIAQSREPDYQFVTYETAGYETLPTY